MARQFDTYADGHRSREQINAGRAAKSLEDWALSILPPRPGMQVLDLGCGTGKLLFPYAERILPRGSALGLDIAADSVDKVNDLAARNGQSHVTAITGTLDDAVQMLGDRRFDAVVSSYAIYYAIDMVGLLGDLRAILDDHGQVFVCGCGDGTNRQMADLVRSVAPDATNCRPPEPDFITPAQTDRAAAAYASAETLRLPNEVCFAEPEPLLNWWRSHNSYVQAADVAVEVAVREHFDSHGEFRLTKNVLGVLFRA